MEAIISKFGLVVITRTGSDPYRVVYESDLLTRHQVMTISLVTAHHVISPHLIYTYELSFELEFF